MSPMQPGALPDPKLITHPNQLAGLVGILIDQPSLAVDTESNSLYAYREQVCLLQFSTTQIDYLVDPLILLDLSSLAPVFADPKIEKIFHAAEYDVICLKRDFGFEFANLFDTMVAARILGRSAVGLGSLLEAEFAIRLDKRYQRANWGQRPLPPDLLAYARLDTHYLFELRDRLKGELEAKGLWPLAVEDFKRLCHVNGRTPEPGEEVEFSVNGFKDLTPQQNAVLLELYKYRDRIARLQDRPLFKVMGNKTLHEMAEVCPNSLDELGNISGMSPRQVQRHGKPLLQAIQRGLQAEPVYPQKHQRPDERILNRLDRLREWRKQTAQAMKVESDVVLPRDLMFAIAEGNPRQPEELAALLTEVPWRLERFGENILKVVNPKRT
jgi:ribonuclease D